MGIKFAGLHHVTAVTGDPRSTVGGPGTIVTFSSWFDPPGLTGDEDKERLGESLMLPPWLEEYRKRTERSLPPVHPAEELAPWRANR